MAENKLVIDLLSERLQHSSTSNAAFSDPTVYCYNSFLGLPVARQAASYFLAKRFYLTEQQHPVTLEQALDCVRPDHIGIGAGAVALLNGLFYLLGDEGDACLIPAPYYAAFESDMAVVSGIVPFAVHMANPSKGPSESELDLAFMEAKSVRDTNYFGKTIILSFANFYCLVYRLDVSHEFSSLSYFGCTCIITSQQGLNPRFLLITNPNNPLGVIYGRETLLNAVAWARKRRVHTILDEIYGLSTHTKYGHGYESIIKILDNKLGDDVHFVWSISKDFGASGLRVGIVVSKEIVIRSDSNESPTKTNYSYSLIV
jgi:1-aminocyclopropane-1-carboxylate synthase